MPDLSANQIAAYRDPAERLCPSLGARSPSSSIRRLRSSCSRSGRSRFTSCWRGPSTIAADAVHVSASRRARRASFCSGGDARVSLRDLMEGVSGGDPTEPLTDAQSTRCRHA